MTSSSMMRRLICFFACFSWTYVGLLAQTIAFNRDIRPILSDKCFACHGPSKDRKADLRLDTFEGATDPERKGGVALIPGHPQKSELYLRLISQDSEDIMPPQEHHKTLKPEEIELIKQWILQGAKYEKHWSFMPIKKSTRAEGHLIDYYIEKKHREQGKGFSPLADKRSLLRRLSLDVTGLPPSQQKLQQFLHDDSPDAYQKQVEAYLNSDHYGEHMARIWLDLVRYGDTHGLHADNYREMYLYRDWVIKAYQNNMPFDQFVTEQLAGDLLDRPSQSQLIASGFNRLHLSNSAGSALEEELYVNNVVDRVNAFGTVFMGLTLGCASCHDHKYDPISQKEYYQLFAFFNNMDGDPDNKGVKSPEPALHLPSKAQKQELLRLEKELEGCNDKKQIKQLKKKIEEHKADIPSTMIMKERKQARPAYILIRGQYDQKGERVLRDTPEILPEFKSKYPLNRLGLARWITDKDHPLLARLTVNRLWQQCFGVGLFKTSQDLGAQGEWPTHPELLDALAHYFIQSGWDVKEVLKLIFSSRTYQQSSSASKEAYLNDPENRLLTHGPRFRMDAEMLRDQALYVSGLLIDKKYGKSVKVPQPEGLWAAVALQVSNTKKFVPDTGDNIHRKSIYTFWKRSLPPPAMTIFNAPSREVCVSRRERTNTPLQALVLMNEPQFFEAAKSLAKQCLQKKGDVADKISWLYEKVTCNLPDENEMQWLLEAYQGFKAEGSENYAWTMLSNSLMNLDIFKSKG